MTDLTQALAELRRVTPPNSPWEAGDLGVGSSQVDYHIATILNAVISGDLIPKAEIEKALSDPTSVHYSMLKGTIAKPTLAQIIHLYGGDLIPRADADLAMALMVEKAAEIIEEQGQWMQNHNLSGNGFDLIQQGKPIRALVPADALAELQALRDELAEAKKAHDVDQKACLSAWGRSEADLAVALMVEKACHVLDTAGDSAVTEALGQKLCCSGHDCGCRGADVGTYLIHLIRALAPASALAELQALRDARTALTGDRAADFDNDAVYQFSKLMKDKMAKSRAKGRKGWNDPTQCSPDFLRHLLYEHIYKGDPVDVANLCMMLRHYDEPTTPKPEDDLRLLHTEAAEAELATLRAQVERLTGALTIAANRLHRCSVDYDTGTREFIEVGEWADEARAALTEGAAP